MNNNLFHIQNLRCVNSLLCSLLFNHCYPTPHAHTFTENFCWGNESNDVESRSVMQMQRERKKVRVSFYVHFCVHTRGCMCVHQYDSFRAAALGQLILSHLRSWVRIIKPISRQWLLQPVCDWITTQPLPSAQQRERMREVENETQEKKEIRKEIKKKKRVLLKEGWWWVEEKQKRWDRDLKIKIFSISHQLSLSKSYLLLSAQQIYCKCFPCWLPIKCNTLNVLALLLKNDLSYQHSPLLVLLYILYPLCRVSTAYVLVTC